MKKLLTISLLLLAGCSGTTLPVAAPAQTALNTATAAQESVASAAVDAAGTANALNPDGTPKVATAGELGVAKAHLPAATATDAAAQLANVNLELTNQAAAFQAAISKSEAQGVTQQAQIATLTTQVAVQTATAATAVRNVEIKVWQTRMMGVGLALFLVAAGLTAAGVFIGIPKLYQVAIVPAAFAAIALFAAYEAGTAIFSVLAFITIAGAVASLAYGIYTLYNEGATNKTAASGFKNFVSVLDTVADKAKAGVETGAVKLWDYCYAELSEAEQALVAKFAKPTTPPVAKPTAPPAPIVSAPPATSPTPATPASP